MRFLVRNQEEHDVRFVVEPWGDFVMLKPGDSIGVISSDEAGGYVNLNLAPSQVEFWAEGSRELELRLDRGEPSTRSEAIEVDDSPSSAA